jgi:hypothetical protein
MLCVEHLGYQTPCQRLTTTSSYFCDARDANIVLMWLPLRLFAREFAQRLTVRIYPHLLSSELTILPIPYPERNPLAHTRAELRVDVSKLLYVQHTPLYT